MDNSTKIVLAGLILVISLMCAFGGLTALALIGGFIGGGLLLSGLIKYL